MAVAQANLLMHIVDDGGRPYSGIEISLVQLERTTQTDPSGHCRFDSVPPGIYALSVDYRYDIAYKTITIGTRDTFCRLEFERRVEFGEVLVRSFQLDLAQAANASLLNHATLRKNGQEKDLPYLLVSSPGLLLQSDAGNGIGYTGLRFRGLDPGHVQVTLNGIPFTDAESSLSYFVDIPDVASGAESITLLRGNVPNRGGAPSFGGAVDIFTNGLKFDPELNVQVVAGSFSTRKLSVQASSGLLDGKYHFELGLSKQVSHGYIERAHSDLKSFRLSAGYLHRNYALRFNYLHGRELTGQAWFGLPIQYAGIDSLRRFNAAGTTRPGLPYDREIDDYAQDHLQLFYQWKLNSATLWNQAINYTHGGGFYENYQASVRLNDYGIVSSSGDRGDLARRKWLSNDFVYYRSDFQFFLDPKLELRPSLTLSHYNGLHFGDVSEVFLEQFSRIKDRYYSNRGRKTDGSIALKILYQRPTHWSLQFDIQYRKLRYTISGTEEGDQILERVMDLDMFTPRLFFQLPANEKLRWTSSLGYMEREAFREDVIRSPDLLDPEKLYDAELGVHIQFGDQLIATMNAFWMHYDALRALSGSLNDVGEPKRLFLRGVNVFGGELLSTLSLGNGLQWRTSCALSGSRIPQWTEVIPIYNADGSYDPERTVLHRNARLAYQPSFMVFGELQWKPSLPIRFMPSFTMRLRMQYVSDYSLDNTARSESRVPGYALVHGGVNAELGNWKHVKLECWLELSNLGAASYSSHGWISWFGADYAVDLTSNPYIGVESSGLYHYKALYPQALRHLSLGLRMSLH
ncbi:MAG: TonB-dependent receptor [Saprospiraceae bacterium]|nr:TonB-dependent receptor [Saprospiraceae bacterium]